METREAEPVTATLPAGLTVRVRVPASTANLGPGFDCLGMALGMHDEIEVTTTAGDLTVRTEGEGAADVPSGPGHLVVRAIESALAAAGVRAEGLDVLCRNVIPHSRGLGSSASAVVGGLAAGSGLAAKLDAARALDSGRLIQLAGEFEGHPDNAAASVLGGVVISWTEADTEGRPVYRAVHLEPHPDLRPVVLIPQVRSSTEQTRGLLPAAVPHADAAFNVSRGALSVFALTQQPELLCTATQDRLHQDYRAPALPVTTEWITRLRAAGIAATVSGAGPTILALTTEEFPAELARKAEDEGLRVVEPGIAGGVDID